MQDRQFVICIGAEKAGTTTLHLLADTHPKILVSKKKETGFFSNDELFDNGFGWYMETYFADATNQSILFEADPNYCYFSKCVERLHQCLPNAKLIFILRNPVRRAFSQYLMMKKWGLEPLGFEHACAAEAERISRGNWPKGHFGYLDRSDYLTQIKNVFRVYPHKQVYFVKFEDFIANQEIEFNKILTWLGLDGVDIHDEIHANKSSKPKIKILTKLLHHPQYQKIRQWAAHTVGYEKAFSIRAKLENLLYTNKQMETLSPELYRHVWQGFSGDIAEIENLTKLDLSCWAEHN